jgi:hypothetical protein
MLLLVVVVGVLNPNISKIKPPTVTNQPKKIDKRIKSTIPELPHLMIHQIRIFGTLANRLVSTLEQ